jgi:ferredoxin like protein
MKVEQKLAGNAIKNAKESHITLKQEICRTCSEKPCIYVCPGHLYSRSEETGKMVVEYAGCLECGTCLVACVSGAILWVYPEGGFGVQYRYG